MFLVQRIRETVRLVADALDEEHARRVPLQRVRDEPHRFAITHHRKVRARKALTSPLDSVEGIGPARKRALLRHFGSVQAIREAPVDEIVKLGIPERLATRLKETL